MVLGSDTVTKSSTTFLGGASCEYTHLFLLARKAEYDFFKEKVFI